MSSNLLALSFLLLIVFKVYDINYWWCAN